MHKTLSPVVVLAAVCVGSTRGLNRRCETRVIVGAIVVDGSGRKAFKANIRIVGNQIAKVVSFNRARTTRYTGARHDHRSGLYRYSQSLRDALDSEPGDEPGVPGRWRHWQSGPDGGSPWPMASILQREKPTTQAVQRANVIGHATLRRQVMKSDYNRAATPTRLPDGEAGRAGNARGRRRTSTGLEYDIGHPSTTDEVIALARAAARYRGIYMSHVRDEADDVMTAFREAIAIGREAGIPVQISHIKLGTVGVWGQSEKAVELINSARHTGVDITADCYPYDAWSSTITVLIPSRRHDDPSAVKKGLDDVGGADNVLVTHCQAHREYEGKTLEEISRERRVSAVDVYIQIVKDGGAGVVCRSMKESDIKTFYRQPWVMVASDGQAGGRHPRGAGTFPRVLGRLVREQQWITLEEAVRKMTSAPATRLGLFDRGLIREGMKADLVIFDAKRVIDRSTLRSRCSHRKESRVCL